MSFHRISKEEKEKKLAMLKQQQEEKQKTIDAAENALDMAHNFVNLKKFEEARQKYLEAAQNFRKIKWDDQALLVEQEAQDMEKKRQAFEDSLRKIQEKKIQEQKQFEKRASDIIAAKQEKKRLQELANQKVSPEIKRKMDEAQFMLKKANIAHSRGKYKQALKRYKFVLGVYQELHYPESEIEKILEKMRDLSAKSSNS